MTPSYRGDLERCRLLCESTTRFLPAGCEHVLLIDRRDLELFRPLESDVVRVVEAESLIPWWIFRVPGIRRWWASLGSLPIRNWLYQQLLKISAIHATSADVIQFLDSDVTLTRPFPVDYVFRGDKVRLQRVGFHDREHERWIRVAARLLGATEPIDVDRNYIGNLITWTRPNVLGMIERIRSHTGSSHIGAIARAIHFSEYMTYGVHVDDIVGLEASGHFHDDSPNLHLCWDYDLTTPDGLDQFLSATGPEHLGVMIHSKYGIPVATYADKLRALWDGLPVA